MKNLYFLLVIAITLLGAHSLSSGTFTTISGEQIPLHLIQKHLPSLDHQEFRHHVFEHRNGCIRSHSSSLNVSLLSKRAYINSPEATTLSINGQQQKNIEGRLNVFTGNGFTFLYSRKGKRLISAWGRNLQLQPLHASEHPNIFVNVFNNFNSVPYEEKRNTKVRPNVSKRSSSNLIEKSNMESLAVAQNLGQRNHVENQQSNSVDASGRQAGAGCKPNSPRFLRIVVAFDNSWCSNFKNNVHDAIDLVQIVVNRANEAYVNDTCVRLILTHVEAHCEDKEDPYELPEEVKECPLDSKTCFRSLIVLNMFRDFWNRNRQYVKRDVALFFSGYQDTSSNVGRAYDESACDYKYGYGWIEGASPIILAHEIGHLLGANHDPSGFMKASLNRADVPILSPNSAIQIRRYVSNIAGPRCLPRSNPVSDWSPVFRVPGSLGNSNQGGGISFGKVSGAGNMDLFVMYIDNPSGANKAYYKVANNVRRSPEGFYTIESFTGPYQVPGVFGNENGGGGVAIGNIRSSSSNDVLIFHTDNAARDNSGYYRIGFGMNKTGQVLGGWSRMYTIPGEGGHQKQGGGVTISNIRNETSTDLVIMLVNTPPDPDIAYYRIGFDLDTDGIPRGGWGPMIKVPGSFGDVTEGVGVAVYDIDGNGKNDIVIFHIENPDGGNNGYGRIGYDINAFGEATRWSGVGSIREWFGNSNQGGGIAIADLGSGKPTMALFHVDNPRGANSGNIRFRTK